MLCGFDDDLTAQITQVGNPVRGLLAEIHPALKRVVGPRLDHPPFSICCNAVAARFALGRGEADRGADAETRAPQGPGMGA